MTENTPRKDPRAREISAQVAGNLAEIHRRIEAAAVEAERDPHAVTLIAVGKMQPLERVEAALVAGHRVFGENRVQEAQGKWPAFKDRFADVELHLIGPLQTNKAVDAVALFDAIQTVDRPRLARELAKAMGKRDRRPSCFIQVNTGEEPQKAGVLPAEADAFIEQCRDEFNLPVVGLMCIPPAEDEPSLHFAMLAEIAKRHDLPKLSMGMSGDYEIAVQLGATHVRVGTAIFGARDYG